MAKCPDCNHSGDNMVKCNACGKVWCRTCAVTGRGSYPKQTSANTCPYCGTMNKIVTFR